MAGRLVASFAKRYSSEVGIRADFALDGDAGRILVLFGPSGAGKTTILRCLAGLETPEEGFIRFDEETWFDAARRIRRTPQARHLAYVSQDYALFPHLTVDANIHFALPHAPEGRARIASLVQSMRLERLLDRRPAELSGGERQRVALARALARQPRLVLLDEPLAALDLPLREPLRQDLRRLLQSLDVPSIVVTHDRVDALTLGDRMAVLAGGSIRQIGDVHEVFTRPSDIVVAASVGVETVIPGEVVERGEGLVSVRVGTVRILARQDEPPPPSVFVCIRAEDVVIETEPRQTMSARNQLPGRIVAMQPEGGVVRVTMDCGFVLNALVTRPACDELRLATGMAVVAVVKATAVHLVARTLGP